MKKGLLIAGGITLLLLGAGYGVVKGIAGEAAWAAEGLSGGMPFMADFAGKGGPAAFAEKLDLTQAQRSQIKTILKSEKPAVKPLVLELGATWKTVKSQTSTGTVDASKIEAEIAKEQPAVAKLIVEAARTKTQIYNTVLTPAQQKKADTLIDDIDTHTQEHLDKIPQMAGRFISLASWKLNLTDDQKSQIQALVDAGVKHDLPLAKELAQERKAVLDATAGGKFDEAQVSALAQKPAKTATVLATDAAILKSQVFAVLTQEQRDQISTFQEQMKNRRAARIHKLFPGLGA